MHLRRTIKSVQYFTVAWSWSDSRPYKDKWRSTHVDFYVIQYFFYAWYWDLPNRCMSWPYKGTEVCTPISEEDEEYISDEWSNFILFALYYKSRNKQKEYVYEWYVLMTIPEMDTIWFEHGKPSHIEHEWVLLLAMSDKANCPVDLWTPNSFFELCNQLKQLLVDQEQENGAWKTHFFYALHDDDFLWERLA